MQQPTHKSPLQRCCPHPCHHSPALLPRGTDPHSSGRRSGEGGAGQGPPLHTGPMLPSAPAFLPHTVLLREHRQLPWDKVSSSSSGPPVPCSPGAWWELSSGGGGGGCSTLNRFYFGSGLCWAPCGVAGETRCRNTIIIVRGTPALPVSVGVRHPAAMIQGICRGTFYEFH